MWYVQSVAYYKDGSVKWVIHKANIGMIKDLAKLIKLHQAHPPISSGTAHFKGPSILPDPIKRLSVSIDVDMGSQIVDHYYYRRWGVHVHINTNLDFYFSTIRGLHLPLTYLFYVLWVCLEGVYRR